MRLVFSSIVLCALIAHINCFFGFLNLPHSGYNFFESGVLEPLVVQNGRQIERYLDGHNLARIEEQNNAARNELVRELIEETLPPDSAYFAPSSDLHIRRAHHQSAAAPVYERREDEYLEQQPLQSDEVRLTKVMTKKSMPIDYNSDSEASSSESSSVEERVHIENNPLENFFESLVSVQSRPQSSDEQEVNSASSEEEQQLPEPESRIVYEKRTYSLPEPVERRPTLGLIDLITKQDRAYYSNEFTSGEEPDRQEILMSPAVANIWTEQQRQQQHQQSRQEYPSLAIIDLLTNSLGAASGPHNQQYDSSESRESYEGLQRDNVYEAAVPKRSYMLIDEDRAEVNTPVIRDSLPSLWTKDKKQLESIKSNLKDEQEKFVNALHESRVNKPIVSEESFMAPQQTGADQIWLIRIELNRKVEKHEAEDLLSFISQLTAVDSSLIKDISVDEKSINFRLDSSDLSKSDVDSFIREIVNHEQQIKREKGLTILAVSQLNNSNDEESERQKIWDNDESRKYFLIIVTVCGSALAILVTLLSIFVVRRRAYLRNKLRNDLNLPKKKKFEDVERLVQGDEEPSRIKRFLGKIYGKKSTLESGQTQDSTPGKDAEKALSRQSHQDYQELCRSEEFVPTHLMTTPVTTNTDLNRKTNVAESNRSSTSSWSEEPVNNIDIDVSTGHVILAYMETHLNDKNLIQKEWDELAKYEADQNKTEVGVKFMTKNRYSNILPYDHNRVKLNEIKGDDDDYINASLIIDDDPKNPAYIATQGPLSHTTSDFWQMVWEQNSVMIISLCRTVEYGSSKCNQYWPTSGVQTYGIFEVKLVSEHVWCDDYLVRSFYLKNTSNGLSRTVTQFHFLTWPENDLPQNIKSILDFRRKLNRSYKKKSTPIIVHCNDGVGRTGTFILIDMILNKIVKDTKEIDLAATVEYLRDQRVDMIKNKTQLEFAFAVIADEVQNMLKAQDEQ